MSRETVEVYAHWQPIEAPLLIGLLSYSDSSRGFGIGSKKLLDILDLFPHLLN